MRCYISIYRFIIKEKKKKKMKRARTRNDSADRSIAVLIQEKKEKVIQLILHTALLLTCPARLHSPPPRLARYNRNRCNSSSQQRPTHTQAYTPHNQHPLSGISSASAPHTMPSTSTNLAVAARPRCAAISRIDKTFLKNKTKNGVC